MIEGKYIHRFRCTVCKRTIERKVHGNVKRIESYCYRKGKISYLVRIVYRKA